MEIYGSYIDTDIYSTVLVILSLSGYTSTLKTGPSQLSLFLDTVHTDRFPLYHRGQSLFCADNCGGQQAYSHVIVC